MKKTSYLVLLVIVMSLFGGVAVAAPVSPVTPIDPGAPNIPDVTLIVKPNAPTDFRVVGGSSSYVYLRWTDNANNEQGFELLRKLANSTDPWVKIADIDSNEISYHDTSITPDTEYSYAICAFNTVGKSVYVKHDYLRPNAPSHLGAIEVKAESVKLRWRDNSDNELRFLMRISTSSSNVMRVLSRGEDSYYEFVLPMLKPETKYLIRVWAVNGGLYSGYVSYYVTTKALPLPPSQLSVESMGSSEIKLTWRDNSFDEQGFKVYRKVDEVGSFFSAIVTLTADTRVFTDYGLDGDTTYIYKVKSFNENGKSEFSNEASATTEPVEVIVNDPTSFEGEATSSDTIALTWVDNADNEEGFIIEKRLSETGAFLENIALGSNITSYTDSDLEADTSYAYRIKAYNTEATSGSAAVVVRTLADEMTELPPVAPTSLVELQSPTEIELLWIDNSDNELGFKIERRTAGGAFEEIGVIGSNTESFIDGDLSDNTTYSYRVKAYNDSGDSDYSNIVSVTTDSSSVTEPDPEPEPEIEEVVIKLYINSTTYNVNGVDIVIDSAPMISQSRTFLPIRFVAEPLGAAIGWDGAERKVTVSLDGKFIELWIDNNIARVDGVELPIDAGNSDVVPFISPGGRTMLPIRFISEQLGCAVGWNGELREVTITYPAT